MTDFDKAVLDPNKKKREEIRYMLKDRCKQSRLGRSILGEEIDLYKLGSGSKNVLFVGAHHGSEHITASLLYKMIFDLTGDSSQIFGVDKALFFSVFSLFVVPMLNPDGVELSISGEYDNPLRARQVKMANGHSFSTWQANARGVDLNHNYIVGFNEYKQIEEERGITAGRSLYSGEYPESEAETRALANLSRSVQFELSVSLHSQGEEIYYFPSLANNINERNCAKDLIARQHIVAERCAAVLSKELGYKISKPEGTACYGGFSDFTAGELMIPSLTVEIGRGKNPLPASEYIRIKERFVKAMVSLVLMLS